MKITDWSSDFHARQVYREIERALAPALARLMPEFNMVQLGINKPDDLYLSRGGEVRLVIHLKPNGLRMPDEQKRDPMGGFNDGTLETIKDNAGMNVRRLAGS